MDRRETCKLCFIWTYIIGFATHGFCYFNTTFNHDGTMIYLTDDDWKAEMGRYLTPIYRVLRTRYSAPWLTGVLSLAFLSLCAYLTVRMFSINRKSFIVCIAGLFSVNYSLIITNAYCIHDSDSYMFSVLLAVTSAYVLLCGFPGMERIKGLNARTIVKIALSGMCIAGSMALYQAYVTLSFALILIYIIKGCLENNETAKTLRIIAETVIMYIVGAIFYIVGLKVFLKIFNVELASEGHNSITSVFSVDGWNILGGIRKAYGIFYEYFFEITKFNRYFPIVVNVIVLVFCIIVAVCMCVSGRISIFNKIAVIVSFLIFPVVLGALSMISEVAHLMKVQYVTVYFIPLVILRTSENIELKHNLKQLVTKAVSILMVISIVVVMYNSMAFANGIYLAKTLDYQATYELMGNVIADIGKVDGYVPGQTPVAFIGTPVTASQLNGQRNGYTNMWEMDSSTHDFYYSVTGYYTYFHYINSIMNINMDIVSVSEAAEYAALPEVASMPLYPSSESIKMVNGVVIVKFSQEPIPV